MASVARNESDPLALAPYQDGLRGLLARLSADIATTFCPAARDGRLALEKVLLSVTWASANKELSFLPRPGYWSWLLQGLVDEARGGTLARWATSGLRSIRNLDESSPVSRPIFILALLWTLPPDLDEVEELLALLLMTLLQLGRHPDQTMAPGRATLLTGTARTPSHTLMSDIPTPERLMAQLAASVVPPPRPVAAIDSPPAYSVDSPPAYQFFEYDASAADLVPFRPGRRQGLLPAAGSPPFRSGRRDAREGKRGRDGDPAGPHACAAAEDGGVDGPAQKRARL